MSDDVFKTIRSMTDVDELNAIAKATKERIASLSQSMRVGCKVQLLPQYHGRKPYDTIGTLKKKNPKNFQVYFEGYGIWNIPKHMLQKTK